MKKASVVLVTIILGCTTNPSNTNSDERKTAVITDSIKFEDLGLELKFNDQELFDTTIITIRDYGFCLYGVDFSRKSIQPWYSNTLFNNDDTINFKYDPSLDTFLYLNFYWKILDEEIPSLENYLMDLELKKNATLIAVNSNPYTPKVNEIFTKNGVEIGMFGGEIIAESELISTSLEVFSIFDSIKLVGNFQYSGKSSKVYLERFIDVAKSIQFSKFEN